MTALRKSKLGFKTKDFLLKLTNYYTLYYFNEVR